MKKLLAIAVLCLSTSSVFAAHGPAGCGLGSILFEGKEGTMFNVLAATFNGSSGNQTFGMSSGTLGCEDAATAKVSSVSFIEGNNVALSNDVARGSGETLTAYLAIIKKENADTTVLQANFSNIFAKGSTPSEIDSKIKRLL
jgi:hypothetical protein